MYCHECGTANTVDSKYCKECGTKINDGYRTMMLSVHDLPAAQSEATLDKLTRLLDMAFWHNEAGNRDAAVTAAEAALAINPSSTTAHSLLGTLYEKRGEDTRAIEHFEAVLALNPDSAADAAKLDQLRRGVHVKAVTPPHVYLWLPPGLVRLVPQISRTWASLASRQNAGALLTRRPIYAAGAATMLVLVSGLLLLRPWARADAVGVAQNAPTAFPPPAVSSVDHSAFASGSPPMPTPSPPVIMMPPPSSGGSYTAAYYPAPALTSHDPFAGGAVSSAYLRDARSSGWSLPTVPRETAAVRRRRLAERALPTLPLRLTALPSVGAGGIAPAPVTVPDDMGTPLATVASIPQHTVVVSSLGQPTSGYGSGLSEPSSHIHITVSQTRPSDTDAIVASAGEGSADDGEKADTYQQRALSLQQGGDYGQARTAYQRAIHAYQGQIASGRDVETAQRGLEACQTGLLICQQSR